MESQAGTSRSTDSGQNETMRPVPFSTSVSAESHDQVTFPKRQRLVSTFDTWFEFNILCPLRFHPIFMIFVCQCKGAVATGGKQIHSLSPPFFRSLIESYSTGRDECSSLTHETPIAVTNIFYFILFFKVKLTIMLAHGPQTGIGYKRDDGDFFTLPQ